MQVACIPSHPVLVSSELGCVDPFPTMSISDPEEEFFENEDDDDDEEDDDDDDVPNFSDVEAMVIINFIFDSIMLFSLGKLSIKNFCFLTCVDTWHGFGSI